MVALTKLLTTEAMQEGLLKIGCLDLSPGITWRLNVGELMEKCLASHLKVRSTFLPRRSDEKLF
jgi:hypothetical protein